MRRFSTTAAAAAAPVRSGSKWPLASLFQSKPIEDIVELKTIQSVQRLVEQIPDDPAPKTLLAGDGGRDGFASWLKQYQADKQWATTSHVDKQAFEALVQDCVAFMKTAEDAAWQDRPKIGVIDENDSEAAAVSSEYVEAFKVKLAKHKCANAAGYFANLDKDKDGKVSVEQVERLLQVLASGSTDKWLESQFQLFDSDSDNTVNEAESKLILDSMVETQKAVLAEIFALHVANLPKKHEKLFVKSMKEANWKAKIPEKVRCVFHFADKEDEEGKQLAWDSFKASQEEELAELDRILAVYAKGFYDDRYSFYERKRDRRSTRIKGLLLATALAFGDYLATIGTASSASLQVRFYSSNESDEESRTTERAKKREPLLAFQNQKKAPVATRHPTPPHLTDSRKMMMMQRSLVRSAAAAPRSSTVANVRHFRKTAPTKLTENKQVSGLAGVIEADNATFTTKVYHYSSMALLGLTPVAFVLSPSPVAVPVDFALGVLFPIHAHIGMNNVISDYVPKATRTLARVAWLGVTGIMLLGFLRVNIEGPGITETIKTVWRESPNKKHE